MFKINTRHFKKPIILSLVFLFALTPLTSVFAVDGSDPEYGEARKPVSSSLKQEPGSISGAFTYEYPLDVPPGRNGMQPNLTLSYNSQNNNVNGIFGQGWDVNIPYIEIMNKKGIESMYDGGDSFFYAAMSGELNLISTSTEENLYGARFDNGDFISYKYLNNDDSWEAYDKSGNIYEFGTAASTKQNNSADTKTFKWLLEKKTDRNGNSVDYTYYKDDGQIYPNTITYTNHPSESGIFEVDFLRESRSDQITKNDVGFDYTTNYRIYEIQIKINDSLVKKYELDYSSGDNYTKSLLTSIQKSGQDTGVSLVSMPANTFDYATKTKSWDTNTGTVFPAPILFYWEGHGYIDAGTRLAELNGDGLIDVIKYSNSDGGSNGVYLNDGDGTWSLAEGFSIPQLITVTGVDNGVRIVDINGDGLDDFLYSDNVDREVYINKGDDTGWEESETYSLPVYFLYNSGGADNGVRFADVNGDGLTDILYAFRDEQGYPRKVYINNGEDWAWDENYLIPMTFVDSNEFAGKDTDTGVRFADVNNDGLIDIVQAGYYGDGVYINKGDGTGWAINNNYTVPFDFTIGYNCQDYGVRITDVNGDNLPDMVLANASSRGAYINKGEGYGWVLDNSYSLPVGFSFVNGAYGYAGTELVDLDGDTLPDFIYSQVGDQDVAMSEEGKADLLEEIEDENQATYQIEYQPSAQFFETSGGLSNPNQGFSFPVMKNYIVDDGQNSYTTSYEYAGGEYVYFDEYDRKFTGFENVRITDPLGNEKSYYYHQGNGNNASVGESGDDESKIGHVFRTDLMDDSGNVYQKTLNNWDSENLSANRKFVSLISTLDFSYDGDGDHKDRAASYDYDSYGNKTLDINWGEVTGSLDGTFSNIGSDLASTTVSYLATSTNSFFVSRQATYNSNEDKIRESKYYYDNLAFGQLGIGNNTKEEAWISDTTYADTEKAYNTFGLITSITDLRDKTTSFSYDDYELYAATSTNPLSQTVFQDYDYSSGQAKSRIDENSNIWTFNYDGLDRVISEYIPSDSGSLLKSSYTYNSTNFPNLVYSINYLDASKSRQNWSYFNGLKQLTQSKSLIEDGYSTIDYKYNGLGLVEKSSQPYFTVSGSSTAMTTDSDILTTSEYDPLKRISSVTNSLGSTTYSYDQWVASVTDPNSHQKKYYYDARNNLIQVDEISGANTYSTEYDYNTNGNLTQITDSADNVRNFDYDALGRLLESEDLHDSSDTYFGSSSFVYDNAGNLTSKTDAKSQTVNYVYDDINRLTSEDYTGGGGTEVTYSYDNCLNGVGKLCTSTSDGSVSDYDYFKDGLLKEEDKTINGSSYVTGHTYSRQGDLLTTVLPDESEVKHDYDNYGMLSQASYKESGGESFTSVLDHIEFNAANQPVYQETYSGVKTYYNYDKLNRLTNKSTLGPVQQMMMSMSSDSLSSLSSSADSLMVEDLSKRTLNSKTYYQGDEYVTNFYPENIHYLDKVTGQYKGIDVKLVDSGEYWEMDKASYKAKINKNLKDNFITFINDDQELYLSLLDKNSKKDSLVAEKIFNENDREEHIKFKQSINSETGLDIHLRDNSLVKDVIIESQEAFKDVKGDYEINFELKSNKSINLVSGEHSLAKDSSFTTNLGVGIVDEDNVTSYILAPVARDSAGKVINIDVTYTKDKKGVKITKTIPRDWLDKAQFPVTADLVLSPYSGNGDGDVIRYNSTDWNVIHNSTVGQNVRTSESSVVIRVMKESGNKYILFRGFTPFDTSSLPDNAIIDSASLNLYVESKQNDDNDNAFVSIIQTTQASPTTLTLEDYDQCGSVHYPSEGSSRKSISTITLMQYTPISLNATGLGWINKTGWTKLGVRVGNDILDNVSTLYYSDFNGIDFYASERSGTNTDPYLSITYRVNSAPGGPTGLLTEGQTNPIQITDPNPELSAVFNDSDSSDTAIAYEIQVATDSNFSNIVWDSQKQTLNPALDEGERMSDVEYGDDPLEITQTVYYWRVKFWDQDDLTGSWNSTPATFSYLDPSLNALQILNYEYDDVGNILNIKDRSNTNTNSAKVIDFTYDALDRLLIASTTEAINNQNYSRTYAYSSIGSLTSKSDIGSYTYAGDQGTSYANPHAATSINGNSQTYDNNGNLTDDSIWDYTWDYRNRLVGATNGTTTMSYGYDSDDNRVWSFNGTATTTYPNKYYNITSSDTITKHIFGNNDLIATVEGDGETESTHYLHSDHLGGSSVVSDESGYLEETIDYYPFGEIRLDEKEGTFDEQRKFTGHEYDEDTGLSYMVARYQDGEVGRFLSQDPVAKSQPEKMLSDPQQLNMYSYARNNPLVYTDPTGMYNTKTGQVEKGDTQSSVVGAINQTFNIKTDWATVQNVSFYSDRFQNQGLDKIVGQSLRIGTDMTTDITKQLDNLNQSRSSLANVLGKSSLSLFAPNMPWDVKNSSDPTLGGGSDRKYMSYIYNGELTRYDAPGNINYGYVAKSLGLPNCVIQGGAQGAQFLAGGLKGNGWAWKDNSGDNAYVQTGISHYKATGVVNRILNNLFK